MLMLAIACSSTGDTQMGVGEGPPAEDTRSEETIIEEPAEVETVVVEPAAEDTKPPKPSPTPTFFSMSGGIGDGTIKSAYPIIYNFLGDPIEVMVDVTSPKKTLSEPGDTTLVWFKAGNQTKRTIGTVPHGDTKSFRQTLTPDQRIGILCPSEPPGQKGCTYKVSLPGHNPTKISKGLVKGGPNEQNSMVIYTHTGNPMNIFLVVEDGAKYPKNEEQASTITIKDGFGTTRTFDTKPDYSVSIFIPMGAGGEINLWCKGLKNGALTYTIYQSPFNLPASAILNLSYDQASSELTVIIVGMPGKYVRVLADTRIGDNWFAGVQTGMEDPQMIYSDALETPVTVFKYALDQYAIGQEIRFQVVTFDDPSFSDGLGISEVYTVTK